MAAGGDPLAGGMPLYKFLGNKILTWLENHLIGMNLSEFHSGYRLYSCEALKKIPFLLNSNEWHFDTEILIQFHEGGFRIAELPIPTYYGDEISSVNGIVYAFNCMKSALNYRLHKSRLRYEAKYDLAGDRYVHKKMDQYSSHTQILNWIEREQPLEVLEVGTATGYLTSEMAQRGCKVTGVEQDPEMARVAGPHCHRMVVGDIEVMEFASLGRFDAIIFGDVLEHLRDPQAALRKAVGLLKPDGKILISVPNIANIWVRLNLLMGRFNYSRVGILDETHLHFFTLKTARRLAEDSGLDVISTDVTPIPLPTILPAASTGRPLSILHRLNWFLAKLRKSLFGYQFIIVCRRKTESATCSGS
jgi:2-polyprenyl-3-methyl-5-hydroxy-6-metoxy-1,4-benzoquinol methylase